jgi:hypothetical protein
MKYNRVCPFTEEEFDKLGVNFKLWELCKYQQNIIDKYKEYIEREIHQCIQEEITKQPHFEFSEIAYFRHITIPETHLVVRCDPWIQKNWELLQAENPVITPEYFISLAYREQEENKEC